MVLASCCILFEPSILICAFGITAFVTVCLTVYALVTKTDFTGYGPYLLAFLFMLIGIGALTAFGLFPINVYAYLGILLFSFYLIYDVQKTVGSAKFEEEYSVDLSGYS
ncbi:FAS apoptotic inhibitory [Blastocystis sp. subtype 4]|uniref:FAS apoptotic inhibitory n=1 Tax=Blastocystis sp. subtype 4 TaxID=944170 RepID=UPI00071194D1|nr:FAS apoptotic inhibitory [Blastocystis sp. subtype 4]KNB43848.1 FAS apoptotic inhibitory [Blastocystis sp. subtype 4]|eukprot:XP_014527291.1 FAS apoptotic inhibitory [Blastocystis sp. subtype 4]